MSKSFPLAILLCFYSIMSEAQATMFPANWIGNWKGELHWYKTGKPVPVKVNMELRIHPGDTSGQYSWHIIYGSKEEDSRPYLLKQKDSSGVHWVIDEKNGIILDQFWVGNRFSGVFTVQQSTILNNYYLERDQLVVEFTSIGKSPINTTGAGTDTIPYVNSYMVRSYQKAVLYRIN